MPLTLDQRIQRDLEDLLKKGEIESAKNLNTIHVKAVPLSTKGLPVFFTGDRTAKTVLVMLNPGCDAIIADHNYPCDICKLKIDDKHGLTPFVNSYIEARTNFGRIDHWRYDAFDLKQAQFLYPWKDSNINFPTGFPSNQNTFLDAKEAVLMHKLQLELVPYASKTFNVQSPTSLIPYVETLLDEISSCDRKYVIFCSSKFVRLFQIYNKIIGYPYVDLTNPPFTTSLKSKKGATKTKYHCQGITITYKEKAIKAMIAHSFPMQGLNGDLMRQYGKFCYDNYI